MFDFDDFDDLEEQLPFRWPRPPEQQMRVLCFHGFCANNEVMQFQTAALCAELKGEADFEFLEAYCQAPDPAKYPHLCDPNVPLLGGEVRAWFNFRHDNSSSKVSDGAERSIYTNVDAVLTHVDEYIRCNGPYDVLLGFSQGCEVITMLSAHYERTKRAQKMNILWCPDVVVAMRSSERHRKRCENLRVCTTMVLGREDVHYEAGAVSAACWHEPTIIEHDGGHRIPQERADIIREVADEMRRRCPASAAHS